jgi:hypothetical protein
MTDKDFLEGLKHLKNPLHILLENCELCDKEFAVWSSTHHRSWWCDECNAKFRSDVAKKSYQHNPHTKPVV